MSCIIVITRNGHICTSTLSTLLVVPLIIPVHYVPETHKTHYLKMYLKKYKRIIWVEYGISADLRPLFNPRVPCMILPSPTEVDWEMFKSRSKSKEPLHQRGLTFDTWIQKGKVIQTQPNLWAVNTDIVRKKLKHSSLPPYELFWIWMVNNITITPKTDVPVRTTFLHTLRS